MVTFVGDKSDIRVCGAKRSSESRHKVGTAHGGFRAWARQDMDGPRTSGWGALQAPSAGAR
jgi:hypothetical protein